MNSFQNLIFSSPTLIKFNINPSENKKKKNIFLSIIKIIFKMKQK
jgi:hypothetical protein